LSARADDAPRLADRNSDERGIPELRDPNGDIDAFLDEIDNAIPQQEFCRQSGMLFEEVGQDRADEAPPELYRGGDG
jgi:hypothetical protein